MPYYIGSYRYTSSYFRIYPEPSFNLMKQIRRRPGHRWLNRTVLGIALASLFSDWSHEIATAVLPAFLGSLGAGAAWLGIIEGISDGLSSFAKLGSGRFGQDAIQGAVSRVQVREAFGIALALKGVRFPSYKTRKKNLTRYLGTGCSLRE
jgi:hypothetical protein